MLKFKNPHLLILPILLLLACNRETPDPDAAEASRIRWDLNWQAIDSLNQDLPTSLRVYHAALNDPRLQCWYAEVEPQDTSLDIEVLLASDSDNRETVAEIAAETQARLVVNGGYFRMDLDPAEHVGILKVDGELIEPPTRSVLRGEQRFYVNRSALGLTEDDIPQIGWVTAVGDTVYRWSSAFANREGFPVEVPDLDQASIWTAEDIVGGGPVLIRNGKAQIAWEQEVFFGTTIPDVHPRTAAGITPRGSLILLIVDGRQNLSRGVDLVELTHILLDLGCEEAVNLDGGGSTSMIVDGTLLNLPAGKTELREVMSAIAVFDHGHDLR